MKCPLCEKEYNTRTTLSVHLHKCHHIDGLERERMVCDTVYGKDIVDFWINKYKNCEFPFAEFGSNDGKTTIPSLRNLVILMGLKRSPKEEKATERYKNKYLHSIQDKYGSEITNISQVKEVQKKKELSYAKKYGSYNEYLRCCRERMMEGHNKYIQNEERKSKAKEKYKATLRKKYGDNITNVAQIPEVAAKISERQKDKCSRMTDEQRRKYTEHMRNALAKIVSNLTEEQRREFFKHKTSYTRRDFTTRDERFISSQERRIWSVLQSSNISFLHNCFVFNMNFDVVFPKYHIVLEVQGDFWHCNPEIYKFDDLIKRPGSKEPIPVSTIWERDSRRRIFMETHGWIVRYLWESKINACEDDGSLLQLIKEVTPEIFCDC